VLATVTLASGRASYSTTGLSIGSHVITAHYLGDAITPASTSAPLVISVVDAGSLARSTIRLSPRRTTAGEPVPVDVLVTGAGSTPTGNVALYLDGAHVGTFALAASDSRSSVVQTSLAALPVGSHVLTAVYFGSTVHAGSTGKIELRVAK
jgi:Bacterial Ig-like domain (group 3)